MITTARVPRVFAGLPIGLTCMLSLSVFACVTQKETPMDSIDQQVSAKFTQFENEHDATRVQEALDAIEAAERNMPVGDTAARKQAIARRLRFFAALDRNIDSTWDPRKVPTRGVPPPSPRGKVYPSGEVDPASISDPEVRTQYVEALKANKAENLRYSIQDQLRRIDERAMRFLAQMLTDRYTSSERDRRELEELLEASPASELRKESLRALMPRAG